MSRLGLRTSVVGLTMALLVTAAWAQTQSLTVSRKKISPDPEQENRLPLELRRLGWDQKIGGALPLDLEFVDHTGRPVRLADYFKDRPVLIAPVYYDCPMLCSLVLDGIVRGLKPLKFLPGQELEVLAVSFDPRDTPELANKSRNTAVSRYGESGAGRGSGNGWNFLTGSEDSSVALMDALGFRYEFNEKTGLYGHAGGVVLATPDGHISRYFYGVEFTPKDLRLGLVEASDNRLGSVVDQVLLFCYQYDPVIGKYSAAAMNIVRAGGLLTVLLLGIFLVRMFRRDARVAAVPQTAESS